MDARWVILFGAVLAALLGGLAVIGVMRRKGACIQKRQQEFANAIAAAPDPAAAVLTALESEARRHRRRSRIGRAAIITYASFALIMLVGYLVLSIASGDWSKHLDMLKFLGQFGGFAGFTGFMAISQIQRQGITALAGMDDVRAVGPLAEALGYQEKDVSSLAAKKLVDLLPRMQASDAHLLDSAQRGALNRALKWKNQELALAILKTYEQVGDESAIPIVTDLADSEAAPAAVRNAAAECLPFLHQSAEREKLRQTLLRPSSASGDAADLLLRPAEGAPAGNPSVLLRPADAPEAPAQPLTVSPSQAAGEEQTVGAQQ